ncbi:MAG: archease [Sulfolobales archaeon]
MSVEELKKYFREYEHTADVMFSVENESLLKLYELAALGMFSYMTELDNVESRECINVYAEGFDLENLMYRWLENLLILHDERLFVASRARVNKIVFEKDPEGLDKIILEGVVCGEIFDRNKHPPGIVVKAVTYAQMQIKREDFIWKTFIVLDI